MFTFCPSKRSQESLHSQLGTRFPPVLVPGNGGRTAKRNHISSSLSLPPPPLSPSPEIVHRVGSIGMALQKYKTKVVPSSRNNLTPYKLPANKKWIPHETYVKLTLRSWGTPIVMSIKRYLRKKNLIYIVAMVTPTTLKLTKNTKWQKSLERKIIVI